MQAKGGLGQCSNICCFPFPVSHFRLLFLLCRHTCAPFLLSQTPVLARRPDFLRHPPVRALCLTAPLSHASAPRPPDCPALPGIGEPPLNCMSGTPSTPNIMPASPILMGKHAYLKSVTPVGNARPHIAPAIFDFRQERWKFSKYKL